jgi:hypothetical protein
VKQPTIQSAVADCREAWAEFFADNHLSPDATVFADGSWIQGWCIHHQQESEALDEPIENRIRYILRRKPEAEQALRFINLRPVSLASIASIAAPRRAYDKVRGAAWAKYDKVTGPARAEYDKVRGAAWAEYEKVRGAAWAKYDKVTGPARAEYDKVRGAAHRADVPEHTWNGKSIFNKGTQEVTK